MELDMTEGDNIWRNTIVTAKCWWRERNNRTFTNLHNTVGICMRLAVTDITSWTGINTDYSLFWRGCTWGQRSQHCRGKWIELEGGGWKSNHCKEIKSHTADPGGNPSTFQRSLVLVLNVLLFSLYSFYVWMWWLLVFLQATIQSLYLWAPFLLCTY